MKIKNFWSNYLIGTRKEREEFLKGMYKKEMDDYENMIKKYNSFKSPLMGGYTMATKVIRDKDVQNLKKYFGESKYDEAELEADKKENVIGVIEGVGMGLSMAASVFFPGFFIPVGLFAADFFLRGRNYLKHKGNGFAPGIIGTIREAYQGRKDRKG